MLSEPMMEKLLGMRLTGMAEALKAQRQDPGATELGFEERLGMLVDQQWNWRENQALERRMKAAKLPIKLVDEQLIKLAAPCSLEDMVTCWPLFQWHSPRDFVVGVNLVDAEFVKVGVLCAKLALSVDRLAFTLFFGGNSQVQCNAT